MTMLPGRELDAVIAEKIMELEVVRNKKGGWSIGEANYWYTNDEPGGVLSNPLPEYSTDIAAAWEVVEKLQKLNPLHIRSDITGRWFVSCGPFNASASTAAHAICLAALKAVGVEC